MPLDPTKIKEKITQLEERKQAATDSGIEDEATNIQEDIDYNNDLLKTVEADAKAAKEAEEKAKEEKEEPKEEPKEEKQLSEEEIIQKTMDRIQKENEIKSLAAERGTQPHIIKAALDQKPEDFKGTTAEYLDSVNLKANKPFDESVPVDPVKEAYGGREPFTKEEIADPNFYSKNQDTLERLYEADPVAHGNLLADHYESPGNLADQMDEHWGWNTEKKPVK